MTTTVTVLKEDEAETIRRAKQGDGEAFGTLFRAYKNRVFCIGLRMTGDRTKTEDLTQEVFLQLFRKIHTFRGESAFSTWLHRVAVNTVLMEIRKRGIVEVSLEELLAPDPNEDLPRNLPRKELGGPDAVLASSIERLHLQRAVAVMPNGYRTVFILHDMYGYEHNEVAEMTGCSVGNSKSQLFKARILIKKLLLEAKALHEAEGKVQRRETLRRKYSEVTGGRKRRQRALAACA